MLPSSSNHIPQPFIIPFATKLHIISFWIRYIYIPLSSSFLTPLLFLFFNSSWFLTLISQGHPIQHNRADTPTIIHTETCTILVFFHAPHHHDMYSNFTYFPFSFGRPEKLIYLNYIFCLVFDIVSSQQGSTTTLQGSVITSTVTMHVYSDDT